MAVALALCAGSAAQAECKLQMLASIPILFVNERPMVEATINGKPALLRFSLSRKIMIWGSALKEYDLKTDQPIETGAGVGPVSAASVRELEVAGSSQKNAHYTVAIDVKKDGEAGLYGNDLFNDQNDIEVDFAHNAVRVFRPDSCTGDDVVYWGGAYSIAERNRAGYLSVKLSGQTVNGTVALGNEVTFVLSDGAQHAGISLRKAGFLPPAMLQDGAVRPIAISIGMFREIVVGDEIIKNVPLAVGDVLPFSHTWGGPQILFGADFVKAHRIYLSATQRKMYFSLVGATVFTDIYTRLGAARPPLPQTPKP
jgi:hypothetical protein